MDHEVLSGGEDLVSWLKEMKAVAVETNKQWACMLDIPESKQLTLLKPSGTVSQLVNSSSGIHPRMFPYYIRRVQQDDKDPLSNFLMDRGVPYIKLDNKYIFSFYIKAPKNSITSDDMSALDQLDLWLIYREYWCDGNPSQTIYYTDDEYFAIADWVWKHWGVVGGLAFFPKDDHIYPNAPYEKITKEQYEEAVTKFPTLDWDQLINYETTDMTNSSHELACSGGACEY